MFCLCGAPLSCDESSRLYGANCFDYPPVAAPSAISVVPIINAAAAAVRYSMAAEKPNVKSVQDVCGLFIGSFPVIAQQHRSKQLSGAVLYPYYRYQLGAFQKHLQSSRRMHFLLREDLRHLDSYPHAALLLFTAYLSRDARNRKVTVCALVQVSSGAKVVLDVPFVIPFSTAQRTAL